MQKKVVLALVLVALVAGGVFADGLLSVGGGALFDWSFNNGIKVGDEYDGYRNMTFGAYGFFDATYVEVDISFGYGLITGVHEGGGFSLSGGSGSMLQIGASLLGKYPFALSKSATLFPLVGGNYNRVISTSGGGGGAGVFSQIGILGGVGADFGLTKSLFLRAEGLFQLRLPSAAYSGGTLGMGPRIKVGIGYKL